MSSLLHQREITDTASISDYTTLNGKAIYEFFIVKDLEGSGHGPVQVWSWHLHAGTKETHEKPQSRQPVAQSRIKSGIF
jgi:hypothetical protein